MMKTRNSQRLPDYWKLPELGDVATLSGRIGWKGLTAKEYTESGPLFLSVHSLNYGDYVDFRDAFHISQHRYDESPEIKLQPGDVLICKDGAGIGKVGIIADLPEATTINSSLLLIRAGELVVPKYLYFALLSPYFQRIVQSRLEGATTPHLYQRDIKGFPLRLPPLPEQERIVAILDEAFAGIATAVANTEKNLASARELFESYLNNVFTQKGEGWVEKTIGEIADHSLGKMLDKAKNKGSLKPYLRNINVRWFEFDLNDMLEMRFEDDESQTYTAKKGDVLICEGGYPGRSAIWENDEPVYFQKALHRVRFKNIEHNKWFLYFIYLADAKNDLRKYFTGTGIQHFTGKALHRFRIPIPPTPVIRKSVERFDALSSETHHLQSLYQHKRTTLAALKQSILHKAFSGALTSQSVSALQEAVA